jgi:hypothetical protein
MHSSSRLVVVTVPSVLTHEAHNHPPFFATQAQSSTLPAF